MKKIVIVDFGLSRPRFLPMIELFMAYRLRELGAQPELITVFPDEIDVTLAKLASMSPTETIVLLWESKSAKSYRYIQHLFDFGASLREKWAGPIATGGYWAGVAPEHFPELFVPFNTVISGLNIERIADFLVHAEPDAIPEQVDASGGCDWDAYPLDMSFISSPEKYEENGLVAGYQTSFGCPNNCYFCYNNTLRKIGAEYVPRSIGRIKEDLDTLATIYGPSRIQLKDLNFCYDKERTLEIMGLFRERGLSIGTYMDITVNDADEDIFRAASEFGYEGFFFGLESFDQESLRRYNKQYSNEQLRAMLAMGDKYKLFLSGSILLGLPWQTKETLKHEVETAIQYMRQYRYLLVGFNSIRPIAGTELQKRYFADSLSGVSFEDYLKIIGFKVEELQAQLYGPAFNDFNLEKLHATALGVRACKVVEVAHAPSYVLPFLRLGRVILERHMRGGCRNSYINNWLTENRSLTLQRDMTDFCRRLRGLPVKRSGK